MELDTTIVVPCYNEAQRLRVEAFRAFAAAVPRVRFLLVDDGSTDDTARILAGLEAAAPTHFSAIVLPSNRGKAEAVRVGMLRAFDSGSRYAGYWDADLATPLSEIPRFISTLDERLERDMVLGARVQLLGRGIHRKAHRHYVGRVFATAASRVLSLPVYDTQCGAKLFRVSPSVRALFAEPFLGKWTFDIEIIARLTHRCASEGRHACDVMYELALEEWRDIDGSKVRPLDFLKAMIELGRIRRRYFKHSPVPRPAGLMRHVEHRIEKAR